MSLYNLIQRAEYILKKYEKYDKEIKPLKDHGDAFLNELEEVNEEVEKLMAAAEEVKSESSRAMVAAKNAEIRRAKNVLLTEAIDELHKKAKKGTRKKKEMLAERHEKIKDIMDKIYAIPDGMSLPSAMKRPQRGTVGKDGKRAPLILDSNGHATGDHSKSDFYRHTEQTQQFEAEKETAFKRQDAALERIGKGVDTLGEMARNMNEEIDKQNPIIDDIEQGLDKVSSSLKTNNAKLKGIVHKMRSSRNVCCDIMLICILLAIGGAFYAQFA